MSDLVVDGDALQEVRTRLRGVAALLEPPAKGLRGIDATGHGTPYLDRQIATFATDWAQAVTEFGTLASSLVTALQDVEQTIDDTDADLAADLERAKSSRPGGN
ncbi:MULTISPECIES: hypothetical protein [Mumia]|uniref:hypothetical protein n=1 Tax=Mumia TaxID=1546255 RepID=UPI001421309F|nr:MULTISPECIES: hypothetical protein [unclassified Mumia]QMW66978.1 hypothetical protein H4N58_03290 [Mumia sp. ZJ1417]